MPGLRRNAFAWTSAGLLLLLLGLPAHAALSPLYESIREIQAILEDPRVAEAFPDQSAITSIDVIGEDQYQVGTDTCEVDVHIVDVPAKPGEPMIVGPRKFTLEFDDAICAPK